MTVWFSKLKCLIRPMSLSLSQTTQMKTVYEGKPDYFTTAIHRTFSKCSLAGHNLPYKLLSALQQIHFQVVGI